jgi:Predicted redox protein, regulator of disulfide bond formation
MNFDKELNASGMSCPLPILKTKKTLNEMASEQVLKVISTDRGSIKDMQAFADQTGNTLLSTEEANGAYIFYIKKK